MTWFYPPVGHTYMGFEEKSTEAYVGVRAGAPGLQAPGDKAFGVSPYGGIGLQGKMGWVQGYAWLAYTNYKPVEATAWEEFIEDTSGIAEAMKINSLVIPHFGVMGAFSPTIGSIFKLDIGAFMGIGYEISSGLFTYAAPLPTFAPFLGFQLKPSDNFAFSLRWAFIGLGGGLFGTTRIGENLEVYFGTQPLLLSNGFNGFVGVAYTFPLE